MTILTSGILVSDRTGNVHQLIRCLALYFLLQMQSLHFLFEMQSLHVVHYAPRNGLPKLILRITGSPHGKVGGGGQDIYVGFSRA